MDALVPRYFISLSLGVVFFDRSFDPSGGRWWGQCVRHATPQVYFFCFAIFLLDKRCVFLLFD